MPRLRLLILAAGLLSLPLTPAGASAQTEEAIIGGVAGAAGGLWWTLSITSARARGGDVLFTPADVRKTAITLVSLGTVAGVATGIWAEDRLGDALLGGAIGWATGLGLGYVVGDALWDDEAGGWAGAVIGSGAGLAIGAAVAGLLAESDEDLPGSHQQRAAFTFQHSFRIGR